MEFKLNRTTRYLLPYIADKTPILFSTLDKKIDSLVSIYLYDCKKDVYQDSTIYILCRFNRLKPNEFNTILEKLKKQSYYVDDYLFGDYIHDFLHVFVVKIDPYVWQSFINSNYSDLNNIDIRNALSRKIKGNPYSQEYNNSLQVVTQNKALKIKLETLLNTNITGELDSVLNPQQELLNFNQTKLPPELEILTKNYNK